MSQVLAGPRKDHPLSVLITSRVFMLSQAKGNDRLVLLVLADHASDDGSGAYPSQATVAAKANCTSRAVRTCLRRLEGDLGEIEREGVNGRTKTISYRITLPDSAVNVTPEDISGGGSPVPPNHPEGGVVGDDRATPPTCSRDGESEGKDISGPLGGATSAHEVWAVYAEVMQPRRREPTDEELRVIRDALKVASVEECQTAIVGCSKSSFHMGQNDRGNKYNQLSKILRGRRGQETTRERIDYFIDRADKSAQGSGVPSGDPGVINQRKLAVQRGWRFRDMDPAAVQEAEEAEEWLREHGIETNRRDLDGYPTFRALRGSSTT